MARHAKRLPAWVLGLLIAALIFALILIISGLLGVGDDPVVGIVAG